MRIEEEGASYARVVMEPLPQGFAVTIGNALRRMLLSSLPGAAVTAVQIEGVMHEFSTIPHVKDDVIEFIINVKRIRLRALSERPGQLILDVTGRVGLVTAADLQAPPDYEIVNPDLYLATLDSPEGRLRAELTAEPGYGYVPAGHSEGLPIGVIPVDAIFTPVVKANYRVERAQVGQDSSLERLLLEVWTDGTISGVEAVSRSAEGLVDLLSQLTRLAKPALTAAKHGLAAGMVIPPELYEMTVEDLNLSMRAQNCLKRSGIMTVGEILEHSEEELLALRNFGRKSYDEMMARLVELDILKPEQMAPAAPEQETLAEEAMVEEPPSVLEEEETPAMVETEAEPETQVEAPLGEEGEPLSDWQRQLLRLRREVGEE